MLALRWTLPNGTKLQSGRTDLTPCHELLIFPPFAPGTHFALVQHMCSMSEWLADGRLAAPPRQTGVIKTALLNGSSNGCNLFVTAEQVLLKINHLRKRQTVLWWSWKRFGLAAVTEGTRPCLISTKKAMKSAVVMLLTNPLVLMDNLQIVSLLFAYFGTLFQNVAGQTQTCIFHMSTMVQCQCFATLKG